ncbi:MAG: hypothetical protein M9962_01225 [Oligoflexia bacterium]|nr:hypothetical protein [Oligoflexia bacterium]
MRKNSFIFGAAFLLASSVSLADSTATAPAGAQSSTSTMLSTLKKKVKAAYSIDMLGATVKSLSGNSSGNGTDLLFIHYPSIGYRIGSKWSASVTQPLLQYIDEKPSSQVDPLVVSDPYLTFSNSKILGSDKYGVDVRGYFRYYIPVSRSTRRSVDNAATSDMGYGKTRLYLNATKPLLDGALSVYGLSLTEYRFAERSEADRLAANGDGGRNTWAFDTVAGISYDVLKSASVYLEYETGFLRYTNYTSNSKQNVKWNKFKDGHTINFGSYITAVPKLLINPHFDFMPKDQGLSAMNIGLFLSYTFL